MKRILSSLLILMLVTVGAAFAANKGTPDQAKAMAEAGAEFYKANGLEKSLAEFGKKDGKFVKDDLYIFVMDFKGKMLAHPMNAKLVGVDLMDLKDVDGKLLSVEMINIAKTKGSGWIDYKWTNPETKRIQDKTSYIIRIGDAFLACGAYK